MYFYLCYIVSLIDIDILFYVEKLKEVDSDLTLVVERREEGAGFLVKTQDDSSAVEVQYNFKLLSLTLVPWSTDLISR